MSNPFKVYEPTQKDLRRIEDMWLTKYNRNADYSNGGNTRLWLEVIQSFMEWRGDEIFVSEFRDLEDQIIGDERSEEYVAALLQVTTPPGGSFTEHEARVRMLTASPAERIEAMRKINL